MNTSRYKSAFTMIEILVTVSVIAVISGVALLTFGGVSKGAREAKLQSDVNSLNRAVQVYLANGGSLEDRDTPQKVLNSMRKIANNSTKDRVAGLASSMVDFRTTVKMQTRKQGRSDELRAYWDYDAKKFYLADSGPRGVREFYLSDDRGELTQRKESRTSSMLYAADDGWVWDYQDRDSGNRSIPTVVTTNPDLDGVVGGTTPDIPDTVAPPIGSLGVPVFSILGGDYDITDYDLMLTLSNPNPAGTSDIYYSVDGGATQLYTGAITVEPNSTIDARAIAIDPGLYNDSGTASENYNAQPVLLASPVINKDRDEFGLFSNFYINVTIDNPNPSDVSQIVYRIEGGPWETYTNGFQLYRFDYPDGVLIEAKAVPTASPLYLASLVESDTTGTELLNMAGNTSGGFNNPVGHQNMITNLTSGASNSNFVWGDGSGDNRSESWMQFTGGPFSEVTEGERFQIGSLSYFNGTILANTGADTVDLTVDMPVNINGNSFNPSFDFTLELINTPNTSDAWNSADYVKMENSVSSQELDINGQKYTLEIEFGETTADGFANFTEFHVLEERDATVNVYGTFKKAN